MKKKIPDTKRQKPKIDLRSLLGDDDDDAPSPVKGGDLAVLAQGIMHKTSRNDGDTPSPRLQKSMLATLNAQTIATQHLVQESASALREIKAPSLLTAPLEYFSLTTASGDRIQIIDKIGNDWQDCVAYHWGYRQVMHLKVRDLQPQESVRKVMEFLSSVK